MQRRSRRLIAVLAMPLAGSLVFGVAAARTPNAEDTSIEMVASLGARTLTISRGGEVIKTFPVAVGASKYPTPTGNFNVRKVVWNPSWVPPDAGWARGKSAKGPGHPANPMKLVKIFFQEPDYYIHGTGAVESLGSAASHGCLRMDPNEAAEVALMVMEDGGIARDWDWVKGILHVGEAKTVTLQQAAQLTVVQ